jgi:hypothetical protein
MTQPESEPSESMMAGRDARWRNKGVILMKTDALFVSLKGREYNEW